MSTPYLEYELQDGFIHNWLVAGPLETPVEIAADDSLEEAARKLKIAQGRYSAEKAVEGDPIDRGPAVIDG
ncbi:MAG: hypothetical protein MUQ30_18735, partial [Anaerolineae bacterium]|nr:hypothetical protein [Anaerolineae bacterium]